MGYDAQLSLVDVERDPELASARPGAPSTRRGASHRKTMQREHPTPTRDAVPDGPADENPTRPSPAPPAATGAEPAPPAETNGRKRVSAEQLASGQRDISVSEFFVKNRHLLGFDSPARALLTTVKEAVDNALDACEEAGILPTVVVELQQTAEDRFKVCVQDNGPGIVAREAPKIFGKLLYGSKFHRLKQSRGQQGIGISAAGMYGQLTTGKPVVITSRTSDRKPAHYMEVVINTKKNAPEVIRDMEVEWAEPHGTRVEIELEGSYKAGRRSIDEYLEQTALANPHAEVFYLPPKGRKETYYPRLSEVLPPEPETIKPHPHGIELGILIKLLKETSARTLKGALQEEFSRVSGSVADEICQVAELKPTARPGTIANREVEALFKAIQQVKLRNPSTTCIVPIGEELIRKGLEREIRGASFYTVKTRSPMVYRGNPFLVEVGLAYGGQLTGLVDHGDLADGGAWVGGVRLNPTKKVEHALAAVPGLTRKKAVELLLKAGIERSARVGMLSDHQLQLIRNAFDSDVKAEAGSRQIMLVRLANRVPLQYQQAACAIHKAVGEVNWRRYGITQPRGSLPLGPMVLVVHIASVWVPFTSESKEAIAHYPEVIEEIKRGVMDCARELGDYLSRRERNKAQAERRGKFDLYCGELIEALHHLTGRKRVEIRDLFARTANEFAHSPDFEAPAPEEVVEEVVVDDRE